MSVGDWRRQWHVILALQKRVAGDSVQNIAIDLGYESASSFIAMFRKTTGKSPMRYLKARHG
ncbi:helix-turn-helix domain-containing protein [Burkholderia alba]|uniref:helix-turn-helix domain-containing protein n=1 Tax=Burkholderia alba TaxID=2683677 RepID=UPI002B055783|nr:helix-turn-helix domain-containing protein [Burkholderia alba]